MTVQRPLTEWRKRGVTGLGNRPLPVRDDACLAGHRRLALFLVYDNYEAILGYNCAHTYALSVALLSDRLK